MLISVTPAGLYCAAGDFYIDPWRPVAHAVITHAHADHARPGSARYTAAADGIVLLRKRLGDGAAFHPVRYGESFQLGDTRVSLHPAGHVLGSAQIRVEHEGEVWVVSGDFKRAPDPTCAPFEVVACDTFITEATFALPVYRWPDPGEVARDIHAWWQGNAARGTTSVLFCYALGKAQRVLAELARLTSDAVHVHGAVQTLTEIYRAHGVHMLPTRPVGDGADLSEALILAPPGSGGSPWMRRFRRASTGFCSGWMQLRGNRRRRGYDRGFVFSDHADWPALVDTIRATGARRVLATHGQSDVLARYLTGLGIRAAVLETAFEGENGAEPTDAGV